MSMLQAIVANYTAAPQASRQSDTPKIAAIYARVSTTDQADKRYSLSTQLEVCQAMAQREGYAVPDTHVFVDDYTGTSLNRPQFAQLRDLVQQRQPYIRQLAQCDKDLKRWEGAYMGEVIDLTDFKVKKAEVDARRVSAEQELARLDERQRLIEQA